MVSGICVLFCVMWIISMLGLREEFHSEHKELLIEKLCDLLFGLDMMIFGFYVNVFWFGCVC